MNRLKKSQYGFTLVELSIVLVIIGLIVSSVLVGQTLVRSAELRATLTQLESFNAAVGAFRGKYNGLPGDVPGATNFGFTGNGNSNGVLYAASSATGMAGTRENNYFWNHLGSSGAALIPGVYTGNVDLTSTIATISAALPAAKAGNFWGVFAGPATTTAEAATSGSESGSNYYILGVTGDATAGAFTTTATLTPLEAQSLDLKVDDGKPSSGTVRARGAGTDAPDTVPTSAVVGDVSTCVNWVATSYTTSPGTNTYATKGAGPLCTLRFRMPL